MIKGISRAAFCLLFFVAPAHAQSNSTPVMGTIIEENGSTSLVEVGSNFFFYPVGQFSGPELSYNGTPFVAGQFGGWTPIGVEQTASGYEVAWKVTGADQYTVWNTDSSGNYTSNAIWVVSGSSVALELFEPGFQQDLNGDGVIGVPSVIEAGATSLVQVGSNFFFYPVGGSSGPELSYNGTPFVAGQFGGWTPIGVAQTASGYEVAWQVTGADEYTVWNTDSSGNYVSNAIGGVSGSSVALELFEPGFQQDLNGDGVIGVPSVIEAEATSLVQVGSNFFFYPVGGSSGPELSYNGTPFVAGQFGGWTPIGVAQTASGYEVAWKVTGADQYTVWNTDSSGNYTSNAIGVVSGSSVALESLEPSFQQDLNGDGVIGVPQVGPTTVNGACGSANGVAATAAPTTGLCTAGTATTVIGAGPWAWTCNGSNGGSYASCSAPLQVASTPVNGACGSANGVAVTIAPTAGLCTAGIATTVTGAGPWAWTCNGSNGGTNSSCSAPLQSASPVNGVCGSANGVAVSTAPTGNLCTAGTATTVSGTGPWSWACNGSNGGANASCSAPVGSGSIIPSDRNFTWNPGMMSKGGIPNRTTICATLSPSGGDDSAAIQAKLDSCPSGQVVMLNPGVFTVNNYLLVHSSITLRGSGAGTTILKKTNGAKARTSTVVPGTITTGGPLNNKIFMPSDQSGIDVQPIIIVGQARWPKPDSTTSRNLTADGVQGAMSVTIANASGFTAGQWVLLDEISNWSYQTVPPGYNPSGIQVKAGDHVVFQMHNPGQSWDDPPDAFGWFSRGYPSNSSSPSDTDGRMTSEIKEIASVVGNVVTFTSPLTIGYRVNHLAQLTRYTANSNGGNGGTQVVNAGVENLTAIGGSDGGIRFEVTAYCWAKNVELTQWRGEGVAIDNSFRTEIRDSYIYTGAEPTPGGGGYAISFATGSSEILIENNISRDVNKVMVSRASGAGSVVAYNYMDDGWISYSTTFQEIGLNASHMAGPHHVLFEGNWGFNGDSDYTHGSSQYITFFRNYLTGQRGSWTGTDDNARTAGVSSWAKSFSFVGNVLGRPGQMSGWNYTDPMMGCDVNGNSCVGGVSGTWGGPNVWQIGYDATNQWTQSAEQGALTTVIRDGNYDYLTNSQRWHNTPGGFAIPNSMYLTSKPAFFGNTQWPWIGPSTGTIYTLPAKARYDAGTPNSP